MDPTSDRDRQDTPTVPARTPRVLNKSRDGIPAGAVYCGRPSPFGNPFVIGRDGTREQVVDAYSEWIQGQPALLAQLPTLAGRDLVCFCAPQRCHCDVLLKLANASPARLTPGRGPDGRTGCKGAIMFRLGTVGSKAQGTRGSPRPLHLSKQARRHP